jgi:hypothetical protein
MSWAGYVSISFGWPGSTIPAMAATTARTMADIKNAQGHQASANKPAKVAPRTIPVGETAAKRL